MRVTKREMRWAAGGAIAGFLLCYVLIAAFQRPAAPALVTKVTQAMALPPGPPRANATWTTALPVSIIPSIVVTNLRFPEIRIEMPARSAGLSPEPPSAPPRPGYSLDLIDTRYQPPVKLDDPK